MGPMAVGPQYRRPLWASPWDRRLPVQRRQDPDSSLIIKTHRVFSIFIKAELFLSSLPAGTFPKSGHTLPSSSLTLCLFDEKKMSITVPEEAQRLTAHSHYAPHPKTRS